MTPGLEGEHEALLQFLYMAPIGLVQIDSQGEILMVNPLCAQLLMPLSRDGGLANLYTVLAGVAPDLRLRAAGFAAPHGKVFDAMPLHVGSAQRGSAAPQVLSLSLLKLDEGRLMAVISDVTESLQRERELRQSQAWVQSLVSGISDYSLLSLDAQGRARDWNPGVARMTGFDQAATVRQSYALFYPPEALPAERVQERLQEADRSGWSLDEGWRVRADGSRYWGSCLISPLHAPEETLPEQQAYSLIIRDVSGIREAHEVLRNSMACDALTGLANRRAFFEAAELELQRWWRQPRPLALVTVAVDRFERFRQPADAAGDAVLRHLAAALQAGFRSMDVVARLDAETFIVLLAGTREEVAASVAQRLGEQIATQRVEWPAGEGGASIAYTVSAGVAAMASEVDSLELLIRRADTALRAAQALGSSRVEHWQLGDS